MQNELRSVYRYFSHHMRNCTALIATSVTLMTYELGQADNDELISDVTEASFLLDLFDASMNLCMEFLFGQNRPVMEDIYEIHPSLNHFFEQCARMVTERELTLDFKTDSPAAVKGSAHELRTLVSIVLYEMIIKSAGTLKITAAGNMITAASDEFRGPPPVWQVIKKVLAAGDVAFEYHDKGCSLEFRI